MFNKKYKDITSSVPINNAFLIFFSGFLISDVIKVTLFQVIEANKAPTTLVKIIFKVLKSKLMWL